MNQVIEFVNLITFMDVITSQSVMSEDGEEIPGKALGKS